MSYSEIFDETSELRIKPIKRKKKKYKKKSHFFAYLYLFAFIFLVTLFGLSHIIKSYSPKVDIEIGNNEQFTIGYTDTGSEIKTIDERLKWIQMEDELPSVSVKMENKPIKEIKPEKKEKEQEKQSKQNKDNNFTTKAPKPNIRDIKNKQEEFKNIPTKEVVVLPKRTTTKVYLGNYSTLEDAVVVQNKVNSIEPGIVPFVKSVRGHYIVQLGSFSDSEKAGILVEKLRAKGYYPKITYEH